LKVKAPRPIYLKGIFRKIIPAQVGTTGIKINMPDGSSNYDIDDSLKLKWSKAID